MCFTTPPLSYAAQGYTALDTVLERLASKAESGQSYDLEEEHVAVRDLLRSEMRRRGYEMPSSTATGERASRQSSGLLTQRKQAHRQVHTLLCEQFFISCLYCWVL